jgi:hypothetical protein
MMKIRTFIITILIIIPSFLHAQSSWVRHSDFPDFRDRGIAFSIGGFGYAGTGSNFQENMDDLWRYDPYLDKWTEMKSMPTFGRHGAFCFVIGDTAYIGGGVTSQGEYDYEFWKYVAPENEWCQLNNIPRFEYTGETLFGFAVRDTGYLLATFNPVNFYKYNVFDDTWEGIVAFPGEGRMDQAGFTIGDNIYIGTGFAKIHNSAEFWEFDTRANKWTRLADYPGRTRTWAVGFSIGDKGYIGHGVTPGVNIKYDFCEYDTTTNQWTKIEDCGYAAGNSFAFSIGNTGYVGTGFSDYGNQFWGFRPELSTVSITKQDAIEIYPNPTTGLLSIRGLKTSTEECKIFDAFGKVMKQFKIDNSQLDISNLSNGLYFISITGEENKPKFFRVVKL